MIDLEMGVWSSCKVSYPHRSRGRSTETDETRAYARVLEGGIGDQCLKVQDTDDQHEIPKEPKIKTGRISLTFRQLV